MLNLNLSGVEVFIKKYNKKNQESFWSSYDLFIWKKDSNGYMRTDGMFRKDAWGIAEKISVDSNGVWKLPKKYVRYFK